jgi:Family of unknown function (DUF5670)
MGNLLYVIAVILIIAWAIGFFAFSVGGIIHVLLVIAIIAILFRIISGRKILD